VTTVTDEYDRISMHGVRRSLLHTQAESLGIPLHEVHIPPSASNDTYEAAMTEAFNHFYSKGIRRCIFGDLYLEDIREYRDRLMKNVAMEAIYPVWGRDTKQLARNFIDDGFKAILACVDPKQIDPSFAGRDFDESLLDDLPDTADPCGENGEFHTFVHNGPIFNTPVPVTKGEIVERGGFVYADIL
jgi:uncharacterized protein (TIGR00290 family)